MDQLKLIELAKRFRKAIESIEPNHRPIGLQRFPQGSCGDTALLFGAYLADQGINGFMYVCGERGNRADNSWTSHAWLQKGDLVVDLTADQFPDAPAGIIVAESSEWHSLFTTDSPQSSDFRKWTGYGADLLCPMYAHILKVLDGG